MILIFCPSNFAIVWYRTGTNAICSASYSKFFTWYLNSRTVLAPFASRGSEFHLSATLWLKFLRSSNLEFYRTMWCLPSAACGRPTGVWWNHLVLSTSSISFKILKACTRSWPCLLFSNVSIPNSVRRSS